MKPEDLSQFELTTLGMLEHLVKRGVEKLTSIMVVVTYKKGEETHVVSSQNKRSGARYLAADEYQRMVLDGMQLDRDESANVNEEQENS